MNFCCSRKINGWLTGINAHPKFFKMSTLTFIKYGRASESDQRTTDEETRRSIANGTNIKRDRTEREEEKNTKIRSAAEENY